VLRFRITLTYYPDANIRSPSPLWERGEVRGTVRLATLVAPSPAPSPIQGEGDEESVTVLAGRSTKAQRRQAGWSGSNGCGDASAALARGPREESGENC